MSIVTIVGAGMMGSAMCWPLADNHHEIRLVGTPLDTNIITRLKKDGFHPTLERVIPEGVHTYHVDQLESALETADWVISGVSRFGVDWFDRTVGALLKKNQHVLSVTKGLEDQPNGDFHTAGNPPSVRARQTPSPRPIAP